MERRNNNEISARLAAVRERIATAAHAASREPDGIRLLAVTKAQPVTAVRAAWAAGQRAFGENYVQEASARIAAAPDAEWHFIGRLQANKTRVVAERFAWVHTVDRPRIAERLAAQRPASAPPLDVCIQVNLDDDPAKGGVDAAGAPALAAAVAELPRLRLRGLMTIPRDDADVSARRAAFRAVRLLYDHLCGLGHPLDTLSMGMSEDIEAAIAEGATIVRIGTAIFGPRA